MTYKVWVVVGFSDGDCDLEVRYITSDSEKEVREKIESMDLDVLAFSRVEGVGVSEGLERTPSPSPLSPLIFEVTT